MRSKCCRLPVLSELAAIEASLVMCLIRERALVEASGRDARTQHATSLLARSRSVTHPITHCHILGL